MAGPSPDVKSHCFGSLISYSSLDVEKKHAFSQEERYAPEKLVCQA